MERLKPATELKLGLEFFCLTRVAERKLLWISQPKFHPIPRNWKFIQIFFYQISE